MTKIATCGSDLPTQVILGLNHALHKRVTHLPVPRSVKLQALRTWRRREAGVSVFAAVSAGGSRLEHCESWSEASPASVFYAILVIMHPYFTRIGS